MQVQKVTNQPNFNGKLVFDKVFISKEFSGESCKILHRKFKETANLISNKPYDIFVMENEQNPDFYNVAANKTLEQAKKVKEYTVKIQKSIMPASFVDAAKDAMEMYEKYISKSIKG